MNNELQAPEIHLNPTRNIWVSSDFHFNHANILKFKDSSTGGLIRGDRFSSVEEMNEHMIERHNNCVKPGDIFYTLGDVVIGDHDGFKKLWPRLKGSKRLIVGNHDDIPFLSKGGFFKKVLMWRMFPEFGLMFSHVPLHESSLLRLVDRNGKYPEDCITLKCCHGHIHQNSSPEGPYQNLSMEAIDYTPVHIEDLRVK